MKWLGGKPVIVNTKIEDGFKIKPEALKAAITAKTKAILLNNPCNPTGAVYSKAELEALAKEIVAQDIYCISDEVYEYFVYDTEFCSAAALPGMAERTIVINGFSKSHCMTGWRIGYDAAPAEIAKIIGKIQGQATHHPSNVAQYAALGALQMDKSNVHAMQAAFRKRRDYMLKRTAEILPEPCHAPEGAFYLFAPVKSFYGKKTSEGKVIGGSIDFANTCCNARDLRLCRAPPLATTHAFDSRMRQATKLSQKACDRFIKRSEGL